MNKKVVIGVPTILSILFLAHIAVVVAAPVYIDMLTDFPVYPYNTGAYQVGNAFVGCGPTTGAMILGYFQHHFGLSNLLKNPVAGVNEGLDTAWELHDDYLNTRNDGFGEARYIKPGLEQYAANRGHDVQVMIHAATSADPATSWLTGEYGPYGDAWTNDGVFWIDLGGNVWDIDPDLFCDWAESKLSAAIGIILTVDSDGINGADHWIPCVGCDKAAGTYYYYDTYDTTLHSAAINGVGAPGSQVYAISFVRSITYLSSSGNQAPQITPISGPDEVYRGDIVKFEVTGTDPDGDDPLSYEWTINGYVMEGASGPTLTFIHTMEAWSVGENVVAVRITDARGAYTDVAKTFTTLNHPPTISSISGETSGERGTYTWTAMGSDVEDDGLTYEWYIDGELKSDATSFTYTFDSSDAIGSYTISVRVNDAIGDYSDYSTLNFNLQEMPPENYELTVAVSGSGTTTPVVGIHPYAKGTGVTVIASPTSGWTFSHWLLDSVNAGSTYPFLVTMNSDHNLTAVFVAIPPTDHGLTIALTGFGTTSPVTGSHLHTEGSTVTVTAQETVTDWIFDHWELDGVDVGDANPYTVTMDTDHALTAVFREEQIVDTLDPVADAGSDQTVTPGTTCVFDAGGSSDNVGIVTYEWDFGDDTTGTGRVTTHTYVTAGIYSVMVTVWDAANNFDVDALTITVRYESPHVEWWMLVFLFIAISATAIFVVRSR